MRSDPAASPLCLRLVPPRIAEELQGVCVTTVEWSDLRARCEPRVEAVLRATGLPYPWDIDEFCDRLERHRGRIIDLVPVGWTVGESTGAWQRRGGRDVIAYAANTSGFHQDHIILHEIGHMIADHRGRCVLSEQKAQAIAPDLAPAAFAHLLDRVSVEAEEHEAEIIATLFLSRIAGQEPRRVVKHDELDASTAASLNRLTSAFDLL